MPDFVTFRLGAPVKAEFEFRGEHKRVEVDGHFDIVVPSTSEADTTLVAILERDRERLEFRMIEGRLFRPFFQFDRLTVDDLRGRKPPTVNLESIRELTYYRKTPLLGSPWLDWEPRGDEPTDAMRARVRRAAPQEWDGVGRRLQAAAARGLRVVNGTLFQETRTPGWGFAPLREAIRPWMPDAFDDVPSLLFDPRIAPSDLAEVARRLGTRVDAARLQVIEQSLLPDTVESDAVAAFALWAYDKVCGNQVGAYDIDRLSDVLNFIGAAEKAILNGRSPNECLPLIERIAQRNRDRAGVHTCDGESTVRIAAQAARFIEFRPHFAAPASVPAIDENDADDIARVFGP